ncbi:MAG: hypothetical protein IMZ46_19880 [Acidobacteria bacterium]|nr:hypothetical protein [Acidobacteriota bacterium]
MNRRIQIASVSTDVPHDDMRTSTGRGIECRICKKGLSSRPPLLSLSSPLEQFGEKDGTPCTYTGGFACPAALQLTQGFRIAA